MRARVDIALGDGIWVSSRINVDIKGCCHQKAEKKIQSTKRFNTFEVAAGKSARKLLFQKKRWHIFSYYCARNWGRAIVVKIQACFFGVKHKLVTQRVQNNNCYLRRRRNFAFLEEENVIKDILFVRIIKDQYLDSKKLKFQGKNWTQHPSSPSIKLCYFVQNKKKYKVRFKVRFSVATGYCG